MQKHLNPIRPALRQLPQEFAQVGDEVAAMIVIGRPESGKLKHQPADVGADCLARLQEP